MLHVKKIGIKYGRHRGKIFIYQLLTIKSSCLRGQGWFQYWSSIYIDRNCSYPLIRTKTINLAENP